MKRILCLVGFFAFALTSCKSTSSSRVASAPGANTTNANQTQGSSGESVLTGQDAADVNAILANLGVPASQPPPGAVGGSSGRSAVVSCASGLALPNGPLCSATFKRNRRQVSADVEGEAAERLNLYLANADIPSQGPPPGAVGGSEGRSANISCMFGLAFGGEVQCRLSAVDVDGEQPQDDSPLTKTIRGDLASRFNQLMASHGVPALGPPPGAVGGSEGRTADLSCSFGFALPDGPICSVKFANQDKSLQGQAAEELLDLLVQADVTARGPPPGALGGSSGRAATVSCSFGLAVNGVVCSLREL